MGGDGEAKARPGAEGSREPTAKAPNRLIRSALFPGLEFEPARHEYFYQGELVPSVTQLVGSVKPLFDARAAAERVGARPS